MEVSVCRLSLVPVILARHAGALCPVRRRRVRPVLPLAFLATGARVEIKTEIKTEISLYRMIKCFKALMNQALFTQGLQHAPTHLSAIAGGGAELALVARAVRAARGAPPELAQRLDCGGVLLVRAPDEQVPRRPRVPLDPVPARKGHAGQG